MEKKKIKIGIDLDDTVWNLNKALLEYCNNKFSKNFVFNDCVKHDILNDFYGIKGVEIWDIMKEIEESGVSYELMNDVKEVLNELRKRCDICFITARAESLSEKTIDRIYSYFDFEAPIYFGHDKNGNKIKNKNDFCKELGISIMIDDVLHNLEDCARDGIKCLLLDSPWNRNIELHKNITRVSDWNEIKSLIINSKREGND